MAVHLKPGPIEHLDHAWQPQRDAWKKSVKAAATGLAVIASVLTGRENPGYVVTRKVDDGMSIRIARLGEVNAVGYKGPSSPLFVSERLIDEYFEDKPEVAHKLKGVLRHCQGLEIPERCYIQAGYLGHDDDGLMGKVTPNILDYEIANGSKLAIVPISVNYVSERGVDTLTVIGQSFNDAAGKIFQYDNIVSAAKPILNESEGAEFVRELSALLGVAGTHAKKFFKSKEALETVNHSVLTQYLNYANRSGEKPRVTEYVDFAHELATKHAGSLKTEQGKARVMSAHWSHECDIDEFEIEYRHMFSMIHHMHAASALVAETNEGEGYTVGTLPDANGNYICLKVVDPKYTALNHSKWNQR